jgi:undecaprenyl-diphosphatase
VFLAAVLCGYLLLLAVMVLLGFAVIDLVLPVGGLASADQDAIEWLADGRNSFREDLSWVGSTLAGGVVIPVVIGVCLLVFALLRRWRLAAFVLFAVALESGVYRVAADIVNRERPDVKRLESLPVDASYPSGHTAASIALYGGLLLLLASKINRMSVVIPVLLIGVAIPVFVAWARLYRGMHHLTDAAAGVVLGVGAVTVLVFASRAAGAAAERRDNRRRELTTGLPR